jgi:hypothetical protein
MVVEEISNGRRYRCSDVSCADKEDQFGDIVFTVQREMESGSADSESDVLGKDSQKDPPVEPMAENQPLVESSGSRASPDSNNLQQDSPPQDQAQEIKTSDQCNPPRHDKNNHE